MIPHSMKNRVIELAQQRRLQKKQNLAQG